MIGDSSYNVSVTPEEFWRQVGRILSDARAARHWTVARTAKRAGVDGKTVASIEAGEPGQVDKIDLHAQALGLSIVSVLSAALDQTKRPLTPEARQLLEIFAKLTVKGRRALLLTAEALPLAEETASRGINSTAADSVA